MLTYAASGGAGRDAYSLFALNDGSSVLTAAVAAADQTLNIASASLAGITNGLFACEEVLVGQAKRPPCKDVHVQVAISY